MYLQIAQEAKKCLANADTGHTQLQFVCGPGKTGKQFSTTHMYASQRVPRTVFLRLSQIEICLQEAGVKQLCAF